MLRVDIWFVREQLHKSIKRLDMQNAQLGNLKECMKTIELRIGNGWI